MHDVKLAMRRLRGAPGFTSVAILTLALAIGANTAIFSFADAVLFRPLPYEDSERVFIVGMMSVRTGDRYTLTPYAHLRLIAERSRTIVGVGLFEEASSLRVTSELGTQRVGVAEVSGNYFELLGTRPSRGRLLTVGDATIAGRPAMLTWSSFQQRFGGNDELVGSTIVLGGRAFDLVGVLPPGFFFPSPRAQAIELVTVMSPIPVSSTDGTGHPIVRLQAAATVQQAEAEMAAIVTDVPSGSAAEDAEVPVLNDVRSILYPTGGPVMRFLLAAAGLVLLIGCANLANMLLARTRLREREIGVQAALGATRIARVRPLLIESLVIGLAGGTLALLATSITFDALLRQVPAAAVAQAPVGVDARVVLFSLALGITGGLIFAALPAWRAAHLDALALLGSGGERSGRRSIGRPLLAAQVAVAIALVFGAVIATRALVSVLLVPLGFSPDNIVTVRLVPPLDDGIARQDFVMRAIEALEERPDVVVAGAAGSMPFDGGRPNQGAVDPETGNYVAGVYHVLPGYFETARIELLRGRLPARADVTGGADVAVVAPSAARALFGDRDAIGLSFATNGGQRFTVVGIVGEVTQTLVGDWEPSAYVVAGAATRSMTLVARTSSRNDRTLAEIRSQIESSAPGVPLTVRWWSDTIGDVTAYRNPRFQTLVLGSFAGLALGLTALGVFGLVAFLVASRMRELGIRLAIGATPKSLTIHTIRHVLVPTIAGVIIGLVATRGLARLAEAQLYDVNTRDPVTLVAAVGAVTMTAIIAAWLPARRASRVDPMTVLRME